MKKRDRALLRRGSDCQAKIIDVANLEDTYTDFAHLGTGRFSDVALVTHIESQQRVALKMFRKDTCKFLDAVREYNYSYFLAAHANVVVTYEGMYATSNSYYFAQEFCPTASLREAVKEFGVIGETHAKKIVKQFMAGLEFMHGEGLVHRNLRAKNVLIFDRENFDKIKITDFALTRKTDTEVKHIDQPNEYHAPEICSIMVAEHSDVTAAVDVWAVGVIIYFMLIGKYFEWEQWQKKKTTVMPPKWSRFTQRSLKIFKKTLKPRADDRCTAKDVRKWVNNDRWLTVDMNKNISQLGHSGQQQQKHGHQTTTTVYDKNAPMPHRSALRSFFETTVNAMSEISEQVVSAQDSPK